MWITNQFLQSHELKILKTLIFHELFFPNMIILKESMQGYLSVYLSRVNWMRLINERKKFHKQAFIQAVLLMPVVEQKLSFWMLYFMTNDQEIIVNCRWRSGSAVSSIVGSWWSLDGGSDSKDPEKHWSFYIWRTNKCRFKTNLVLDALKRNYMKIELEKSLWRLSFLCHLQDIKIAWINPRTNGLACFKLCSIIH